MFLLGGDMQVQNSLAGSISRDKRHYDEACKRILAERQARLARNRSSNSYMWDIIIYVNI